MTSKRSKIKLTITDTLSLFNEAAGDYLFNPRQKAVKDYWFDLPADWLAGGQLLEMSLERLYEHIYGRSWRAGNGDGSRFVILYSSVAVLGNPVPEERPRAVNATCYVLQEDGSFARVSPENF